MSIKTFIKDITEYINCLNVTKYLTFRTIVSLLFSLTFSLLLYPWFIKTVTKNQTSLWRILNLLSTTKYQYYVRRMTKVDAFHGGLARALKLPRRTLNEK